MTDQERKYLADILRAIELITDFTDDIQDFAQYQTDLKTQSAVERQLGIIGEAVNQFEKINNGQPLEHSRKIVGFRNRIIHAYDAIDNSMVWTIIKRYLPPLLLEIRKILTG